VDIQVSTSLLVPAAGLMLFAYSYSLISVGGATLIFSLVFIAFVLSKGAGDPYGSFHLKLNKLPGESPGAAPKTEWLNMGYWKA
jgi:hypothetical protein